MVRYISHLPLWTLIHFARGPPLPIPNVQVKRPGETSRPNVDEMLGGSQGFADPATHDVLGEPSESCGERSRLGLK